MQKSALVLISAVFAGLTLSACGGHASEESNPPPPNVVPTANAGSNQTVIAGTTVLLDGTASNDPDGGISTYAWSQTSGATVALSSTTTAQTTFVAPTVAAAESFTFSLVVTDNRGAASTPATITVTVNPPTPGTLTGAVRFMRIPTSANGLNYAGQQLQAARGVVVQALDATTDVVLASGVTSSNGTYVLSVAANLTVRVVVVAQMERQNPQSLPHWSYAVMDVDNGLDPYVFDDGIVLDTSAPVTHDIGIPSGFDSAGNQTSGVRESAPFAILDTVYKSTQLILSVDPTADFPELTLDWATDNPGGETYFDPFSQLIVLSADVFEDTDEFDEHVIAHEFGHYVEQNFSRSDSIGGVHGLGDKLDVRVAFGEGFGYAFAAMVLNDPVARDTFVDVGCAGNQCTSQFNVETNPATDPAQAVPAGNFGCWCSESSVWSILWDVYDSAVDSNDSVALGFAPIWNVLVDEQRTTHAFTSLFTFMSALKDNNPASATALNSLLNAQNTNGFGIDPYASDETEWPPGVAADGALPLYTSVTVGGGAVTVRSIDDAGIDNTLGNRRFLRFSLTQARDITITATSSKAVGDADFWLFHNGVLYDASISGVEPEVADFPNAPAGDYLLEVYEYENILGDEPGDYDINVTVQ